MLNWNRRCSACLSCRRSFRLPQIVRRIHIELDTGMNRLGFREEEFADMIRLIRASQRVNPVSIFTHLSAADMPEEDAWSRQQIALLTDGVTA